MALDHRTANGVFNGGGFAILQVHPDRPAGLLFPCKVKDIVLFLKDQVEEGSLIILVNDKPVCEVQLAGHVPGPINLIHAARWENAVLPHWAEISMKLPEAVRGYLQIAINPQ